ncbi:MAG: hypothetical protein QOJ25_3269 [Solirubrobacteraceae bacterium]|jgi:hypothetical protein|nr:hypothetical protein [Solirubrobacteraceae bacterium]
MNSAIVVRDQGQTLEFSFADMMRYHGPGSPGGVAHAYKVLERALPLLDPDGIPERREIVVRTPFGGPGARDAFELVTRAVTEDRYIIDPALERAERGRALARFVFGLRYRDREVTLTAREGYVTDELIDLARIPDRTPAQESRFAAVKLEIADLVMSAAAPDVYDLSDLGAPS